jgi:heme/copper-type cytochrome/quinol oxidase subunit 3
MAERAVEYPALPVAAQGANSVEWWGLLCLIATESALFAYLLFSYYFTAVQRGQAWLPSRHPSLALPGPNTLILLSSSVAVWWGEQGVKRGRRSQQLIGIAASVILGALFAVIQTFEWASKP